MISQVFFLNFADSLEYLKFLNLKTIFNTKSNKVRCASANPSPYTRAVMDTIYEIPTGIFRQAEG